MANPILGPDQNGNYWQLTVDASAGAGQEVQVMTQVTAPSTGTLSSYTVGDALTLAKSMAKGVPMTGIDLLICNSVNAAIYKSYPWRDTLTVIPAGTIPLVNGQQDYSPGTLNPMRITQFWLVRNDITPPQARQIDVSKNLYVDYQPKSPTSIRAAAWQAGVNKMRLESAVSIPSGTSWELGGEYQPHPAKLLTTNDNLWFADEYLEVFAKGLVYWAFKLADRTDAGDMTTDDAGHARYTGQLGVFIKAIADMRADEDFGNIDGYFPDESIGTVDGRRSYGDYPIF